MNFEVDRIQEEGGKEQGTGPAVRKPWSAPAVIVSQSVRGVEQLYNPPGSDDIGPVYPFNS
jgi:hypothetical protein